MNNSFKKKLNKDYILKNYFYLIVFLVIPSIVFISFLYLIFPNFIKMESDLELAKYLENEYRDIKTKQINNLDIYKNNFENLDIEKIEKIKLSLPEEKDLSDIVFQITSIAKTSSVEIGKISFSDDDSSTVYEGISKINFSIDVQNIKDYKRFKNFLYNIERSSRLFSVESFYVKNDFGNYILNLSCYYKKNNE